MTRSVRRSIAALVMALAVMIAGFVGTRPAHADEAAGSITITYKYKTSTAGPNAEASVVPDAEFLLYKVADWDESASNVPLSTTLTAGFRDNTAFDNITWSLLDSDSLEDWRSLTGTLFTTMKLNGFDVVDPVATGTTDSNGVVKFNGLADGVYFAVSPLAAQPKAVYSAQLISIPENTAAMYAGRQVETNAKGSVWNGKDPIHVKKIWKDGKDQDDHDPIKVTLYFQYDEDGDFEEYETVELNAGNGWKYEWKDLPESMDYVVRETVVPDGYTVALSMDQVDAETSYWTFTNSKNTVPPDTPEQSAPPTTTTTTYVSTPPAYTGSDVAMIALIATSALALGVVLMIELRKAKKNRS